MPPTATKAYRSDREVTWCPGCGDFGVLEAIPMAFSALNLAPHDVTVVSGIGCSSRLPVFLNVYGLHGAHGRALPIAAGVKLGNPQLTVMAVGGDGDGLAIGAGHLLHACRRNVDFTYVMMDNAIYGLTKGQASPTSGTDLKTGTTPYGNPEEPIDPVSLCITFGASFVARGYVTRKNELAELIRRAIAHPGFAFVHAISPCPTFHNTFRDITPKVDTVPAEHDVTDRVSAFRLATDPAVIYTGVFLEVAAQPYDRQVADRVTKKGDLTDGHLRTEKLRQVLEQFA